MADRPIVFSAPMVRALLAGRKTQTRRLVKVPGIMGGRYPILPPEDAIELEEREFAYGVFHYRSTGALSGPYRLPAQVGDRLYVREHWRVAAAYDDLAPSELGGEEDVVYLADRRLPGGKMEGRHRQGMHMPRWASRLTLMVDAVRVERLQAIPQADALAEGGVRLKASGRVVFEQGDQHFGSTWPTARAWYADLWDSLHPAGVRWDDNPAVVVLIFRVLSGNIDQVPA